jgi:hypothetical protein
MALIVDEIRSVYYRALMGVLFPFVFAATWVEALPADWRFHFLQRLVLTMAVLSAMALGLGAVYALKLYFS